MPRAVRDKPDLTGVRAGSLRAQRVKRSADKTNERKVVDLVTGAHVINLTQAAAREHCVNGGCMIFNVNPVSDVAAVAVDRKLSAV